MRLVARKAERDGANRRALSFFPLTAVRTRVASKKARAGGATPAPSREGENGAFFAPYRLNEHKALAFEWKSALLRR